MTAPPNRPNKNVIKINTSHCYRCACPFTTENRKTNHHAIPKSMKPDRNILIPVCKKCHIEIHQAYTTNKLKFERFSNLVKGLRDFLEKQEETLSRARVEE